MSSHRPQSNVGYKGQCSDETVFCNSGLCLIHSDEGWENLLSFEWRCSLSYFLPEVLRGDVKYTPQWRWLADEFKRVDREKTPWLIVLMHAPIYNSNNAHYMEGESMRAVFESWFVQYKVDIVFAGHVHAYERSYRISNLNYSVAIDEHYPVPDKSAPVYITVGDGGNQEGLASMFRDPQPDYSAFREASYGHSTLEITNRTHALYHWNRNDDGKKVETDSFELHNQYWRANGRRRRKLKKNYLRRVVQTIPLSELL